MFNVSYIKHFVKVSLSRKCLRCHIQHFNVVKMSSANIRRRHKQEFRDRRLVFLSHSHNVARYSKTDNNISQGNVTNV